MQIASLGTSNAPTPGTFNLADGVNAPIELLFLPYLDTFQLLAAPDPPAPIEIRATVRDIRRARSEELHLRIVPEAGGERTRIDGTYGPLPLKAEEEGDEAGSRVTGSVGEEAARIELASTVEGGWLITSGSVASIPVRHGLTLDPDRGALVVSADLGGVRLDQAYYFPTDTAVIMEGSFGQLADRGIATVDAGSGRLQFEREIGDLQIRGEITVAPPPPSRRPPWPPIGRLPGDAIGGAPSPPTGCRRRPG